MSAIDAVKAHFEQFQRRRIEVPEWQVEGKAMIVYSEPMTLRDRQTIVKQGGESIHEMFVRTLILKAQDELGKALFSIDDRMGLLSKGDPEVIQRVATEITRSAGVEEMRKP